MEDKIIKSSDELVKQNQFITKELEEYENFYDLKVGDSMLSNYGDIYTVKDIVVEEENGWYDEDGKKLREPIKTKVVKVLFENEYKYTLREMKSYGYVKMSKGYNEYRKEVIDAIVNGTNLAGEHKDIELSSESALMHSSSKDTLLVIKKDLMFKQREIEIKQRVMKDIMEGKRNELNSIVRKFEEKIKILNKVVYTIELYMGINEDIIMLQEGPRANIEDPICFRQEMLYMDEEVGMPGEKSIDIKRIEDFDAWLLRDNNYKIMIPETKGVVVFRVRRKDKEYVKNYYANMQMNEGNDYTFFLIRNGETIYRIWAQIKINRRLFPSPGEIEDLMHFAKHGRYPKDDNSTRYFYSESTSQEHVEKVLFRYKQQGIILQGLIDRTDVFAPLPEEIKLSDDRFVENGRVKFIFDDGIKLPTGQKPWKEWLKEVNSNIKIGSRIYWAGFRAGSGYWSKKDYSDRFTRYYSNEYSCPNRPDRGVYLVEAHEEISTNYPTQILDLKNEKERAKAWEIFNYSENVKGGGIIKWIDRIKDKEKDGNGWSFFRNDKNNFKYFAKVEMRIIENGKYKFTEEKTKIPVIRYNPGDEVAHGWYGSEGYSERVNRISFKVDLQYDNILNYDNIDLKDVDFYLTNRLERRHYLDMMPILEGIKKMRLEEIEQEKGFVELLKGELLKAGYTDEKNEKIILDAIEWWKTSNMWKRPIAKDDELAMRMIKDKVFKDVGNIGLVGPHKVSKVNVLPKWLAEWDKTKYPVLFPKNINGEEGILLMVENEKSPTGYFLFHNKPEQWHSVSIKDLEFKN